MDRWQQGAGGESPKAETRKPNEIPMTKSEIGCGGLAVWGLGFDSDFWLRISGFPASSCYNVSVAADAAVAPGACLLVRKVRTAQGTVLGNAKAE
jgi:hypothetical protein